MRSAAASVARTYRSSRREAQARRTRRRILDAATTLFVARGYAGATMRSIATEAGVSVPTLELGFGTKARLLKAAIDVAIVGDDEAVPVLERGWTRSALAARTAEEFLAVVAAVIGPAQARSAGLVLAVFEGSSIDGELAQLSEQMIRQRAVTARWIVDGMTRTARLRQDLSQEGAVDTVWILMDPALFDRLTRHREWSLEQYQVWFARSALHLLVDDAAPTETRHP